MKLKNQFEINASVADECVYGVEKWVANIRYSQVFIVVWIFVGSEHKCYELTSLLSASAITEYSSISVLGMSAKTQSTIKRKPSLLVQLFEEPSPQKHFVICQGPVPRLMLNSTL